jgi:hypothetical protein
MNEPTRDDYVSLYRKFVDARWADRSLVFGESLETRFEELGQIRLLHFDAILRELGPLTDGEHAALEVVALEFAKQHRQQKGLSL